MIFVGHVTSCAIMSNLSWHLSGTFFCQRSEDEIIQQVYTAAGAPVIHVRQHIHVPHVHMSYV